MKRVVARPWTPRDDAIIVELTRRGWPPHAIALVVPRSFGSIRARLARLRRRGTDLPRFRPGGQHQRPVALAELRADYEEITAGLDRQSVAYEEARAYARRLRAAGPELALPEPMSDEEVAAVIERAARLAGPAMAMAIAEAHRAWRAQNRLRPVEGVCASTRRR